MYGTAVNDMHPVLTERERLQNLADENAKLRTQLADVTESVGRVEERCAKLRELASDMWKAISTHKRINFAQLLRFGERMHELGIEVDE